MFVGYVFFMQTVLLQSSSKTVSLLELTSIILCNNGVFGEVKTSNSCINKEELVYTETSMVVLFGVNPFSSFIKLFNIIYSSNSSTL